MSCGSFLDPTSIDLFMAYLKDHNNKLHNSMNYRLNQIIRANYPFIRVIERTHLYIKSVNTYISFMEIYSYLFNFMRSSGRRLELLERCIYEIIVEKLLEKNVLEPIDNKKFKDIINFKNIIPLGTTLNKIPVKIDNKRCYIMIKNLDDYLSLGISY